MKPLEQYFYEGCRDYMGDEEARGLSLYLAFCVKKKIRHYIGLGIMLGVIGTLLFTAWYS